ncbi:MAG: FAD-dependent oxidoreductase [Tepidisphaeraceae bacterium]
MRSFGFSDRFINTFFRPFFGGVFLETALETSSRAFDFNFRMFADGRAALPARDGRDRGTAGGNASHRHDSHELAHRAIANKLVAGESGESIVADAVVLAVDGETAARLAPQHVTAPARWTGNTTLYFETPRSPVSEPTLLLNGSGAGIVNNVAPISVTQPAYAPAGKSLVAVNLVGAIETESSKLAAQVIDELATEAKLDVHGWKLLRVYTIRHALPDQRPAALAEPFKRPRLREGLYVCGDHVDSASIDGALRSGRRAAEAILNDLGVGKAID